MIRRLPLVLAALLAGCNAGSVSSLPGSSGGALSNKWGAGLSNLFEPNAKKQSVYWTLFTETSDPQIEFAALPLTANSQSTDIYGTSQNMLNQTSAIGFDKAGRLWAFSWNTGSGNPGNAYLFKLPLTSSSVPIYAFVLSQTSDPDHFRFDKSGNLWVNSYGTGTILEYKGPFTKSGTLTPALALTAGIGPNNSGLAFDKHGNLYVSILASTGTKSIAVFAAPIQNKTPYYLNGLTGPGGLIFDKHDNLYAQNDPGGINDAIVRYNSNDLKSGDSPSIVDPTGLYGMMYEAEFALDSTGNLYDADCGAMAQIFVYPTATQQFSSTLAPSVAYTNQYIAEGCAWGIAVK